MVFNNPNFLWALGVLLVPIIIHLFNFRRYKRVEFGNVAMLRQIEVESRKTRQLKKYLVLASRLLALLFLVLAFAKPYIPIDGEGKEHIVHAIYLDNSNSMNAEGGNGQLFELAKNGARQVIGQLPKTSQVLMLSNQFDDGAYRMMSPTEAISYVDHLDVDHRRNDLGRALDATSRMVVKQSADAGRLFVFSDLQVDGFNGAIDSMVDLYVVPMQPVGLNNLSVDTVWIEQPVVVRGERVELKARITNHGDEPVVSSTVKLVVEDEQLGLENISLEPGEYQTVTMSITAENEGWMGGKVIIDDVPVAFDNTYHFSLYVKPRLDVLLWGEDHPQIRKVFAGDSTYRLHYLTSAYLSKSDLLPYDLVIANGLKELSDGASTQVEQYVNEGGVFCLIPNKEGSALKHALPVSKYGVQQQKEQSIDRSALSDPMLSDAFTSSPRNVRMPKVEWLYAISGGRAIIRCRDGSTVLSTTERGEGMYFQWAMPLEATVTDLTDHELFVIAFLKMAVSKPASQHLSYELSDQTRIELLHSTGTSERVVIEMDEPVFVEHSMGQRNPAVWLNDGVNEPGLFWVSNVGGARLARIALNSSRQESVQRYWSIDDLKEQVPNAMVKEVSGDDASLGQFTSSLATGRQLWKLFLILSLIFILVEILLLRYLKS